jgi:hypothetical protein
LDEPQFFANIHALASSAISGRRFIRDMSSNKATQIRIAMDEIVGFRRLDSDRDRVEVLVNALCDLIDTCPDIEVKDLRELLQKAKDRLL